MNVLEVASPRTPVPSDTIVPYIPLSVEEPETLTYHLLSLVSY